MDTNFAWEELQRWFNNIVVGICAEACEMESCARKIGVTNLLDSETVPEDILTSGWVRWYCIDLEFAPR